MRRHRIMLVLVGAAAVWCAAPPAVTAAQAAGSVTRAGTWRTAIEVPGLGSLNKGGHAFVNSVSCASAGNCAAGGDYADAHNHVQAFVVSERNGTWRTAIEVPGSGTLSKGAGAAVNSVSCASAGNCAAGGNYSDGHGHLQALLVNERNGSWGRAIEVPGSGTLNKGGNAQVTWVSCASAGNCAAGGSYVDGSHRQQALVVSERNGSWGRAIEVPGSGTLNKGGNALVASVSCGSAGNCAAGGGYTDGSGHPQGFVVSERNGTWGKAIRVPGLGILNKGEDASVRSVSCRRGGNCAAGGDYVDGSDRFQAFVASETNGTWRTAIRMPGSGALNAGGLAFVNSVSCGSAGNCAAGGDYRDGHNNMQAFVVTERNGTWGKAIEVPGSAALNASGFAGAGSVSCGSAGNCAAGGFYQDGSGHFQGFVASERNGTWGKAIEVPGLGSLNRGGIVGLTSVSCGSAGNCAAGGEYADRPGIPPHFQAFVVSQA